jgi:hypothetical protein
MRYTIKYWYYPKLSWSGDPDTFELECDHDPTIEDVCQATWTEVQSFSFAKIEDTNNV